MFPVFAILKQRMLRWLGQVCRMDDGRIPKNILYGQLSSGSRSRGLPKLRYKDIYKQDLKSCQVAPVNQETMAKNRTNWHSLIEGRVFEGKFTSWLTNTCNKHPLLRNSVEGKFVPTKENIKNEVLSSVENLIMISARETHW